MNEELYKISQLFKANKLSSLNIENKSAVLFVKVSRSKST